MIKTTFKSILVLLFFSSCKESFREHPVKNPNECLGEWKMLNDKSKSDFKSIVLKPNGQADFYNLFVSDIGGDEKESIPQTGTWRLVNNGKILEIWFSSKKIGEYGNGGKLMKKDKLEIWFSVGDPDNDEWKRFRLESSSIHSTGK